MVVMADSESFMMRRDMKRFKIRLDRNRVFARAINFIRMRRQGMVNSRDDLEILKLIVVVCDNLLAVGICI